MNKRLKLVIGLLLTLIIPVSLYLLAKHFSKEKKILPSYYGITAINPSNEGTESTNDTIYATTPELTLNNQLNHSISLNKDLTEKVLIVNFITEESNDKTDSFYKNVRIMQKSFLKKIPDKFQFISISQHSTMNDVHTLRLFADKHHVDHDRWWFLSGDSSVINSYRIFIATHLKQPINENDVILIDNNRHIRGHYDALDPFSLRQCADDAIFLTLEKHQEK